MFCGATGQAYSDLCVNFGRVTLGVWLLAAACATMNANS